MKTRRFLACWAALAGLVALAVTPTRASAEPPRLPATVTLREARCDRSALDFAAFERLLRIELKADGIGSLRVVSAAPEPAEASLAVVSIENACTADPVIVIDDAATNKSVRRTLSLGEVPNEARPRALALATAELLRASWAELVLPDAPPPRAEVPPAVRAATETRVAEAVISVPIPSRLRSTVRSEDRTWTIAAGADVRFFFGGRAGLFGARGGVSLPLTGPLRLRAEIGGGGGRLHDPAGRVDLALITGAVGLAVTVGAFRRVRIELGPEIELGWARASGSAERATTAELAGASWAALGSIFASSQIRISQRFSLVTEVRFGATFHGLTAAADNRDAGGISGATGAARVGVAVDL